MHLAPRRRAQAGFSFIEILVVMGIIVLLTSMVVAVIPMIQENARRTKSKDNLRSIYMMVQMVNGNPAQLPGYTGKNFTLMPFVHGVANAEGQGIIDTFFSPGDSGFKSGDVTAQDYKDLTKQKLKAGSAEVGRLTSYAGRRNGDGPEFVITASDDSRKGLVLFCDDDEGPLHHKDGLCVGFVGGQEFMEWDELGMSQPKNDRQPEPFLGESASGDLLKMLSSSR